MLVETGNKSTVCLNNAGYKILNDTSCYADIKSNLEEGRMRVVKAGADIITDSIPSIVYNTTDYPSPNQFLNIVESDIPPALLTMIRKILLKNKQESLNKWKRISIIISHAIIVTALPRSFFFSLLTGLSVPKI